MLGLNWWLVISFIFLRWDKTENTFWDLSTKIPLEGRFLIWYRLFFTGEHEPNDDECQWPSDDEGNLFDLLQAARD